MGAVGSDEVFVDGTEFQLNQLFGYQSAEASRERTLRLRDALEYQHAWDDTSTDDPGGGWAHAWPLGTHVGTIGWPTDKTQTQFYGDGSGIINIGSNGGMRDLCQTFSNPKNHLVKGTTAIDDLDPGYAVNLTTLSSGAPTSRIVSGGPFHTYLSSGLALSIDYRTSGAAYVTDAQGPTMPCMYLSGEFDLHLYFLVIAHIWANPAWTVAWGGGQQALIRPEFYHANGNIYTFSSDDVTITPGAATPDSTGMFYWLCHWVGDISSYPAGVATLAFSCQGDWGTTGPATVAFYCMSIGQIRLLSYLVPTSGSVLLTTPQVASGMRSTPGVPLKYHGQGPDCMNKFVAFAV